MSNNRKNCCEIPLDSMPLVGEAEYGLAPNPIVHCDRIADFNVLIYLINGEMEIIEDGVTYRLTPGTLFFLKKNIHHWGEKSFLPGSSWYYVHFYTENPLKDMKCMESKDLLPKPQKDITILKGTENHAYIQIPKMLQLPKSNTIRMKLEQLITFHNSGEMMKSNILLWDILETCFFIEKRDVQIEEDFRVEAVHTYLREHYCSNFTAPDLEKATGFSYKYISSLFKKACGKTIKEYQLMLRINKAENLLCSTQIPVNEIAASLGFDDGLYFSRVFKKVKKVSPLQFRKAYVPRM